MKNNYVYRQNDVVVNTDEGLEIREYVDNLDDILKVENNIENIENKIIKYERSLNRKIKNRKDAKLIFNIMAGCAVVSGIFFCGFGFLASGVVTIALKLAPISFGLFLSGGALASLALKSVGNSSKKTLNELKDKILFYNFELEQEKKKLRFLKQESKKTEIPKDNDIKPVSTTYSLKRIKQKKAILDAFRKYPELFIEMYNCGTLSEAIIGSFSTDNVMEDIFWVRFLKTKYQNQEIAKENVKKKVR